MRRVRRNRKFKMSNTFPSLLPSIVDPIWFTVDKPCDDENELSELEEEYNSWVSILCCF